MSAHKFAPAAPPDCQVSAFHRVLPGIGIGEVIDLVGVLSLCHAGADDQSQKQTTTTATFCVMLCSSCEIAPSLGGVKDCENKRLALYPYRGPLQVPTALTQYR